MAGSGVLGRMLGGGAGRKQLRRAVALVGLGGG